MREIKFRAWNGKGMSYFSLDFTRLRGLDKIMEYVGLKDKNKKDKYEGDIIRAEDGEIGVVIFRDGKFQERFEGEYGYSYCDLTNYTGEIIGNNYNNSELLENESKKT